MHFLQQFPFCYYLFCGIQIQYNHAVVDMFEPWKKLQTIKFKNKNNNFKNFCQALLLQVYF